MLARRIAVTTATAVLAAPSAALAADAVAHPSATPLLVELATVLVVATGLLSRRRIARLGRSSWSRVADRVRRRRVARQPRASY